MFVQENISHTTTHPTSGNPPRATIEESDESAPDYSSLGLAYNTTDSRRQLQHNVKNQIPNNVRGRYEFAEVHVETDRADVTVPALVEGDDDDYSRLQH